MRLQTNSRLSFTDEKYEMQQRRAREFTVYIAGLRDRADPRVSLLMTIAWAASLGVARHRPGIAHTALIRA